MFIMSAFVFLTLTFAIPSQILTLSYVYASSGSSNDSDEEDQSSNDGDNNAVESNEGKQDQQDDTTNEESINNNNNNGNDQSSTSQSDQDSSCTNIPIDGPVFIDENGCTVRCPITEDQSDNIQEGCPVPSQASTLPESQGTNPDSLQEIPLQNNNQIQPNTLSGNVGIKERPPDNVILAPEDGAIESLPPGGLNVVKYTKEIGQNCYDRIDNDNDGKIDYENDEDCHPPQNGCIGMTFYACHEICDDGVDNDGDGFTDMQDMGPNAPKDNNGGRMCMSIESFPVASGCFGLGPSLRVFDCVEICNDLVDNDGNGITDGNPCSRDPLNPSGYVIKSTPPPNLNLGG